jgi:hypothetical protein
MGAPIVLDLVDWVQAAHAPRLATYVAALRDAGLHPVGVANARIPELQVHVVSRAYVLQGDGMPSALPFVETGMFGPASLCTSYEACPSWVLCTNDQCRLLKGWSVAVAHLDTHPCRFTVPQDMALSCGLPCFLGRQSHVPPATDAPKPAQRVQDEKAAGEGWCS